MKIVVLGAGTAGLIAALMIKEKYPLYNITVVKSGDIGIIGVGEGSTEHWRQFMDFVGINYKELVYKTKATIKIGILFKDWVKNHEYVHTVGPHTVTQLRRLDMYHHMYIEPGNEKFPLSPGFEKSYYVNRVPVTRDLFVSNQFHFDTFKLNEYLHHFCQSRDIKIEDAIITDILQDESGNITGLHSQTKTFSGDFFIDCSGLKRVIASKIGNKFISMADYLPMNHAIAFPTDFNNPDEIEPYTLTTALSSGWVWKIPTQERYGNGYVFSDHYLNADQALNEVNRHLGKNIEKVARDIKFTAGRVDKFWDKNVVCLGLSSSFAEPLEAQSIGFTIVQTFALLDLLDQWSDNPNISKTYNRRMTECFDNIIDYLQAHYLTSREDTKFWKDKPFKLTDFNRENIPLFKKGRILPSMFNNDELMFKTANWYQVIGGIGLINKEELINELNTNRRIYNQNNSDSAIQTRNNEKNLNLMSHRQLIDLINFNYKLNNEN
jgi:hypothetical protein